MPQSHPSVNCSELAVHLAKLSAMTANRFNLSRFDDVAAKIGIELPEVGKAELSDSILQYDRWKKSNAKKKVVSAWQSVKREALSLGIARERIAKIDKMLETGDFYGFQAKRNKAEISGELAHLRAELKNKKKAIQLGRKITDVQEGRPSADRPEQPPDAQEIQFLQSHLDTIRKERDLNRQIADARAGVKNEPKEREAEHPDVEKLKQELAEVRRRNELQERLGAAKRGERPPTKEKVEEIPEFEAMKEEIKRIRKENYLHRKIDEARAGLEPSKRPRPEKSPLQDELDRVRLENQLRKNIEDIKAGRQTDTPGKAKFPETETITNLRNELSEARKARATAKSNQSIIDDIDRIQSELRAGVFSIPESRARQKGDVETINLRRKRDALKAEVAQHITEMNAGIIEKVWKHGIIGSANAVRGMQAGTDLSGIGRHGLWLSKAHPFLTAKPMLKQFIALGSESAAQKYRADIETRPNAKNGVYDAYGITFHDLDDPANKAVLETWSKTWVHRLPILGKLIQAEQRPFERALVTYVNQLKADITDAIHASVFRGLPTKYEARKMGTLINDATGSAMTGVKAFDNLISSDAMGLIAYAAKYRLSRILLQLGHPFWADVADTRTSKFQPKPKAQRWVSYRVQKALAREYIQHAIGEHALKLLYGVAGTLAYGYAPTIEKDPRSSDFGKLKWGDRRYDFSGGSGPQIVFMTRLMTQQYKNKKGEIVPLTMKANKGKPLPWGQKMTLGTVFMNWLRSGLSPAASAVVDYRTGGDYLGKPVTLKDVMLARVIPMGIGDVIQTTAKEMGVPAFVLNAVTGFSGFGVQKYGPQTPESNPRR